MKSRFYVAGLVASALLLSAACGSADDQASAADDMSAFAEDDGMDVSELPADFPRDLIPPRFTTLLYSDMRNLNGFEGASFESSEPVERSIQHYMDLLGEPTINVDSDRGERNVQWHSTPWSPWIVGVMGNDSETFVSVSKIPK
ncbi:MAG: hypothetical protein QNJ11_14105 [Woeseiaceae bacterium]|nr:hypothetical protein [Woeseiaceae bacterium]